jgi:hypothetical protein
VQGLLLGGETSKLQSGVLGSEIGQVLELVYHHQVLPAHVFLVQVVVRRVSVPHVNSNGNVRQRLPDDVDRLHAGIEIFNPVLRPDHIGHHYYLRIAVLDDRLAFSDPFPQFVSGGYLEED